jgi:abequosyltransferase
MTPRLSICIATFNRGAFIEQTLDSVIHQLDDSVELIVVDGASPDDTQAVMDAYCARHPEVRYVREPVNSGVDGDYDKAVGYARGEFCWLMTDDDLMVDGAVQRVLARLDGADLVIVNTEVRNKDLSASLRPRLLEITNDLRPGERSAEQFFAETAEYLSFIGAVIVRRSWWLARERSAYFGTLFVHIGVLFQAPAVSRVHVIAEPQLVLRYGNAMWSARGFEIWMFKWPTLIWSFDHFSATSRAAVCRRQPFDSIKYLVWFRAIGSYSAAEYQRFLRSEGGPRWQGAAWLVARMPGRLANFVCTVRHLLRPGASTDMALYDLARSVHSCRLARNAAAKRSLG